MTIPANALRGTETFELTPKQDNGGGEERRRCRWRATATGFTVAPTRVVTLTDDDTASTQITLTVSPDEGVVREPSATTVTVTATLSGSVTLPSATTVTVQVGKSDDSAVEA